MEAAVRAAAPIRRGRSSKRQGKREIRAERGVKTSMPIRNLGTMFAFVSLLLAGSAAYGQVSGRLTGTVVDPTGNVIIGAEVTLQNQGTGESGSTKSGELGVFLFPNVLPGTYTIGSGWRDSRCMSGGGWW